MKSVEKIRAWIESEDRFPECLLSDNMKEYRAQKSRRLETGNNLRVFVHLESFIVWETGLHMDTGHSLAQVWAWTGAGESIGRLLQDSLSNITCDLLIFPRLTGGEPSDSLLRQFGFELYRRRFTLRPKLHDLSAPRWSRLRLRPATELDRSTVCSIASNQVPFTLPSSFSGEKKRVTQSTLERYQNLDLGEDSAYDLLIAEEEGTLNPCGFILLRAGEPGTIYLDDLAVKREQWGNYIGHFMVRSVENLLLENGLKLLYADIAEDNRRSHLTATRQLAFIPDLEYWLKKS